MNEQEARFGARVLVMRKLDRMLGELAVREGSVNRSAARRAGVACLHAASPSR